MMKSCCNVGTLFAAVATCILCAALASGANADSSGSDVLIHFAKGSAKLMTIEKGVRIFSNGQNVLTDYPAELDGLMFTQRKHDDAASVTIDVQAGTTVYAMFGSKGGGKNARASAESLGWTRLDDAHTRPESPGPLAVYKKTFDHAERMTLIGAGACGDIIVCKQPKLVESFSDNQPTPSAPGGGKPASLQPQADKPKPDSEDEIPDGPIATRIDQPGNPTTRITNLQSSINALYILIEDTGEHLGLASRLILTATPGDKNDRGDFPVEFTSGAGGDMHAVLEDVNRALRVHYSVRGIKRVEFSFEDKYSAKDGGSIGAAIGTLLLSMIRGFDVDPNFAITGDVTADGRIRAIGGVAAKIRGATKGSCRIVAVPTENLEQVQDAIVYDGIDSAVNVQIIGVANLDDAAGVARVDRDSKLSQAIDLFSGLQASIKKTPNYIFSSDAQEKIHQILQLEPNHYSASLLLAYSRHQLPRLSAAATEYYISVAVKEFWNNPSISSRKVSFSAEDAVNRLNKLRPMSDMTVRPYLDAWMGYIRLFNRDAAGQRVTEDELTDQFQEVLNQGAKLDMNRELSEKLLHEGI